MPHINSGREISKVNGICNHVYTEISNKIGIHNIKVGATKSTTTNAQYRL